MKLQRMTMADADKMLEWKNYEETRKFAIVSQEEIKREDHIKWLEKNIQYFHVVLQGEDVVGAVRLQDNEVSVWIDRRFRGQGLVTQAVKSVSRIGTTAKIVEGNIASMKTFIRCGFLPEEYVQGEINYYIFKK